MFIAGVCWVGGYHWVAIVPGSWFAGMILSHLVFNRCALNELVYRLRKLHKGSGNKRHAYFSHDRFSRGAEDIHKRRDRAKWSRPELQAELEPKGLLNIINDD